MKRISGDEPVNVSKQKSGFAPNFVHSLDASHMMMTALACSKQGITFASVHDSFWTHASMVDDMQKIIRREFVSLHENDILGKLRSEFNETYRDRYVPVLKFDQKGRKIKGWKKFHLHKITDIRGKLKLENVVDSEYFFS